MSHRLLILLPLLGVLACPKKDVVTTNIEASAVSEGATIVEAKDSDGNLVEEIDLDHDGMAEVYNHYRTTDDRSRVLLKRSADLNGDGKVDVTSFFSVNGTIEKEEMDSDFDGKVDWVDTYQAGRRVSTQVDSDHDQDFDILKTYEGGRIKNIERDNNGDGKADFWQYFDDAGKVTKVGWDEDGDGVMDERQQEGAAPVAP